MKVRELIKELRKMPQSKEVVYDHNDYFLPIGYVEVTQVLYDDGGEDVVLLARTDPGPQALANFISEFRN